MVAVPKPKRLKDKGAIRAVRKPYCEWCGSTLYKTQVHHVKAKGSGNPDHPYNLISLCPACHGKAHHGEITARQLFRLVAAREGVDYDTARETVRELKA